MKHRTFQLMALGLLGLPSVVLAHSGVDGEHTYLALMRGLLHPFTGADHLGAMLAVGVWSALSMRPVWLAPAAFLMMVAMGAFAGMAGWAVPVVEPMIAASLLVLGLLMVGRQQMPLALAAALAGGFAFFHGAAHGQELGGAQGLQALAGMLVSTALLHVSGMALGRWVLAQRRWLSHSAGAAVALLGCSLLWRMA